VGTAFSETVYSLPIPRRFSTSALARTLVVFEALRIVPGKPLILEAASETFLLRTIASVRDAAAKIGTAARPAVPVLIEMLTNQDWVSVATPRR
jgi:hypothetical protein